MHILSKRHVRLMVRLFLIQKTI